MIREISNPHLTRRRFVRALGLSAAASLLAACAPIAPANPTPPSSGQSAPTRPAEPAKPAAPAATTAPAAAAGTTAAPAASAATAAPAAQPASAPASSGQGKPGGTLRVATGGPLESLFPFRFVESTMLPSLYDSLIRYDSQLKPQPRLAETWQFSQDRTSITFNLRQNVTFHSGKPMTADDVLYTYKFLTDPKNSSNISDYINLLKDVTASDPHSVTFAFKAPTPAALDMFDLFWVVEKDAPDITTKPAGTGPFVLKDWKPGQTARIEKNPSYWEKGFPYLDAIEYRIVGDVQTRVLGLQGKASDFVSAVPVKDVPSLKSSGYEAVPTPGGYFDVLFNVTYEPLKKPEVRQAISYAINRNRFTQTILQGAVESSCLPFPKASFAYDAAMDQSCAYNVEKAKSMLAQAGLADGFDVKLLSNSGAGEESVKLAELIQNDLQALNIRVKIDNVEAAAFQQLQRKGEFQMAIHTFAFASRDPGSLFLTASVWKAEGNSSSYRDQTYSDLVTKAATTVDEAQRKTLYQQLGKHVLDDPFILVIAPSARPNAWASTVKDVAWNADGYLQFDKTWLAQ